MFRVYAEISVRLGDAKTTVVNKVGRTFKKERGAVAFAKRYQRSWVENEEHIAVFYRGF